MRTFALLAAWLFFALPASATTIELGSTVNASVVPYSPAIPGSWSPAPTRVAPALDQLVARLLTAGANIGGPATGGTAKSVLFVGAGPVLAQDNANFSYDSSTKQLTVGGLIESTADGFEFPDATVQTTAATTTTPGGANKAVQFNDSGLFFNGDAAHFSWDNTAKRLAVNGQVVIGFDTTSGFAGGQTIRGGNAVGGGASLGGPLFLTSGDSGGSNQPGADTQIAGGASTGAAPGGKIQFEVAPSGSSGSAVNSPVPVMTIAVGAVGIGTASPNAPLDVTDGATNSIRSEPGFIPGYSRIELLNTSHSTIVGEISGSNVASATNFSAFGRNNGNSIVSGINNLFAGSDNDGVSGGQNNGIAIGFNNVADANSVAIGHAAKTANGGVSIGSHAGGNGASTLNVSIGSDAGQGLTGGGGDTILGFQAAFNMATGSNNNVVGHNAGLSVTTGSNNTIDGESAAPTLTTGSNNTLVGKGADVDSATRNHATCIGVGCVTSAADNTVTLGSSSDTTVVPNRLGVGTIAPVAKLGVAGPIATAFSTETADYTLGAADSIIAGDATGAPITETLPTAVGHQGIEYRIKKIDSSANTVTVGTTGGETIDGSPTYVLFAQYSAVVVVSDGADWLVFGSN